MSLVLQNPYAAFSPVRTVGSQFVQTLRRRRRMGRDQAYEEARGLLRTMELRDPDRVLAGYAFELSGGMCQRAALALALALRPRLLFADEPTSALDVTAQAQVVRELLRVRDEYGCAVVLVSHNMGAVFHMADRIAVMYAGRVVESGSKDQLRDDPLHPYTRALIASIPQVGRPDVKGIPGAPPTPGAMPEKCRFAPRCPLCRSACTQQDVDLRDQGDGHLVACLATGDGEARP